ncbi:unnamed protein product [Adineta steineri]|uniref:Uncharacterized protein n=1 Tax=Adineta steineri TaxID=433720 RepID=A0A819Y4U0_9BILA|nr:unnamed protein product [Adineta steineri]CAF1207587.1 unnamed protein product [Adineta steineri]CAF1281730.1 unnamed protein product [Adineta steineri]CAF4144516.1 unnamed protein product [Adineta steineri]CAF4159075.1 unnamed protein product [Adineta steineri]
MQSNGIKFMALIMIGLVLCMMSMSVSGTSPPYFPPARPAPPVRPAPPSRTWTCNCGTNGVATQQCCATELNTKFINLQRCQGISDKSGYLGCCGSIPNSKCTM